MKILVLVKNVPDSTATIKVKGDGSGVEAAGLKMVMNAFCEFAVEAALQIKEKHAAAAADITVMTLGPADDVNVIRTAYAMGVEKGVHLCDDLFKDLDELTAARIVAAAIKAENYDLLLTGKVAIDYDSGQFGPALAEHLGLPHVGAVTAIEWAADYKSATVRRRIEGAEEVVDIRLPGLLSIEKGLCEPRYPSLPGLMKAKKKPVDTKNAAALGLSAKDLSREAVGTWLGDFAPPPPRPPGRKLAGEPADAVKELVRALREEEKIL